eukprot:jgi/Ulvmu1/5828/UM025_0086.1
MIEQLDVETSRPIAHASVRAWLTISCSPHGAAASKKLSADSVVKILMAASMLGDEKTVHRVCVAHRGTFRAALTQAHEGAMSADLSSDASDGAETISMTSVLGRPPTFQPFAPCDVPGALNVLPERVSIDLLRAAYPGVAAAPLHSPSYVAVPPELCTLPATFFPLAMHACAPCIASDASLAVALDHPALSLGLDAACAASAMSALTTLTSIALAFSRSASDAIDRAVHAALIRNICQLPLLASLEISDMPLAGIEEAALTAYLPDVPCLRELKLRAVMIERQSVAVLAQTLPRLSVLTLLDLRRCRMCDDGADVLCRVLPTLSTLRDLRVGSGTMSDGAAADIAEASAALPRLQTLWFQQVTIEQTQVPRAAALASVLAAAPALRELHIRRFGENFVGHSLTAGLMVASIGALGRRLSVLDLERSVQARDLAGGALAMLLGQTPRLQRLSLAGCGLTWGASRDGLFVKGVQAAAIAIAGLTQLRELNLSRNRVLPQGAEMLGAAFLELTALEVLDMTSTRSAHASMKAEAALAEVLASCMGHMHALRELKVSCSCFCTVRGAALLAVGVSQLPVLRVLRLADNALDGAGTRALASALPRLVSNRSLQVLDLSSNNIPAKQLWELLMALRKLPGLQELMLNGNAFGYAGALQLMHAFRLDDGERSGGGGGGEPRGLWQLQLLGLAGCGLGGDGLRLLLPELTAASHLKEVHIRSRMPAEPEEERVVASLQSRRPMLYVR